MNDIKYSVFTKPWKELSLEALGELVADMGFDAVEYPLRDGYQVEPSEGAAGIVRLVRTLEKSGVGVRGLRDYGACPHAVGEPLTFSLEKEKVRPKEINSSACLFGGFTDIVVFGTR